jgi:hypothetical protein
MPPVALGGIPLNEPKKQSNPHSRENRRFCDNFFLQGANRAYLVQVLSQE